MPIIQTNAPRYQPRGPIILPKGAFNVARGKPVTGSDDAPIIGDLSMVTDGIKSAEEGAWVELGPGTQWVQIDLKKLCTLHGILMWHYHGESRVYRDVVIQIADDADFTKNVRTIYNNDQDNSSGLGKGTEREYFEMSQGQWIPIKALKARFVRLYSRGNSSDPQNQYIEVEVWGVPEGVKTSALAKPGKIATAPPPTHKTTAKAAKTKHPPAKTKLKPPPGMMVAPFKLPAPSYQ